MRGFFIGFTQTNEEEVKGWLDANIAHRRILHHRDGTKEAQWMVLRKDSAVIWLFLRSSETFLSDFEPEAAREWRSSGDVICALQADVSGTIPGRAEAKALAAEIMRGLKDGIAMDDYSDDLWPLEAIENDLEINGRRFFQDPDYPENNG